MNPMFERSAGVIPYRIGLDGAPRYLVLHSATVRNPRARWEFPKGGIEANELPQQTAAREFREETGLTDWQFFDGFERSLSYSYIRNGRRVLKTVVYYIAEIQDPTRICCSPEHMPDRFGHWHHWGTFEQINALLYHAKIRLLFAEAHAWVIHRITTKARNRRH